MSLAEKSAEGTQSNSNDSDLSLEGATTVESGPLADAEMKLYQLQAQMQAQAHLCIIKELVNSKQRKYVDKQQAKAAAATDPAETEKILEKTRKKMQDELSHEQRSHEQARMKEEIEDLNQSFFVAHAEIWASG